jgi:rhodanese-related sulfurtransferase
MVVEFIIDNILLIGVILISGSALLFPAMRKGGAKASLVQATQLMNQPKCVIVDVREVSEFESGHIRNAKNIPLGELSKRMNELEKHKAHTVLTVCAKGERSSSATSKLLSAGFAHAQSIEGGMVAWLAQGLPVVR